MHSTREIVHTIDSLPGGLQDGCTPHSRGQQLEVLLFVDLSGCVMTRAPVEPLQTMML